MTPVESFFATNVVQFARLLRKAGLRIGPSSVIDALTALQVIDLGSREQVRAALRAVLVHRSEELAVFEQAFALFFEPRRPLPHSDDPMPKKTPSPPGDPLLRRLTDSLFGRQAAAPNAHDEPPVPDGVPSWSAEKALRQRDFADMTAEELAEARKLIAKLDFALSPRPLRRTRPSPKGSRFDFRRTLLHTLRSHGESLLPHYRKPIQLPPPLCVLCDVSGSMSRYSEMLLRFSHTLMAQRRRVEVFLLGTELSRVTQSLRGRDIDLALRRISLKVHDFGGGTRLSTALHDFNQHFSRRVLGQGAWVLLISDGLDRDEKYDLSKEAERLHKSTKRFVFCNPLLGFSEFSPKAAGIRAILPHVDDFRPIHNLDSLADLIAALRQEPTPLQRRAVSATVLAAK